MAKLVQIRDVPDDVHRALKARAATAGISLTEYLRIELARVAARPPVDELLGRIGARGPTRLSAPSEQLVRDLRDAGA